MNASDAIRPTIDLNADLGEGCPNDRLLLDLVSSASVSCGAHAGDSDAIRRTLIDARDRGVVLGAHPGYPDRDHFGRRERVMAADAVKAMIVGQVTVLRKLAAEIGVAVRFLKPHGALYNQAQKQAEIARGVVDAAAESGLALLGQPGTLLERLAGECQLVYIREGFPDRRYRDDGSLVPRGEPDAILHDPAEMEDHLVRLIGDGRVSTLCIHGDDPGAVDNARLVRRVVEGRGLGIRSFADASRNRWA
jgi:UPF0271 protein